MKHTDPLPSIDHEPDGNRSGTEREGNMARSFKRKSPLALVVVGVIAGAILVSPASAHVGATIAHLWGAPNHIKAKVQAFSDARYMRFGSTSYLPPGKTETGTLVSRVEANGYLLDDASFQVPLNFTPTVVLVDNDAGTPLPSGCPGSASSPMAAPGYFCVYAGWISIGNTWGGHWNAVDGGNCGCRRGVVVYLSNSTGSSAEASGTWAVTAPAAGVASPVGKSTPSRNAEGTGA